MNRKDLQIIVESKYEDVVVKLEDLYRKMAKIYGGDSVYYEVMESWDYDVENRCRQLPDKQLMKALTLLDLSLSIYEDYRVGGHHDTMRDCTKLVYRLTLDVMEKFGIEVKERRLRYYDYLSSAKPWEIIECIKYSDYNVYNTIGKTMPQPDGGGECDSDLDGFLDTTRRLIGLVEDKTKEE